MQHKRYGFSLVETILALLLLGLVITAAGVVISKQRKDAAMNGSKADLPALHTTEPNLVRWPVAIANLDMGTHTAGDVYMNDTVLLAANEQPVIEFGREQTRKGEPGVSVSSAITFLTRTEAPVHAASDGYVLTITPGTTGQEEYVVHVAPGKTEASEWKVLYLHVAKPKVKIGDAIRAGDQIGTAASNNGQPYGMVGLQVVHYATSNKGSSGEARCPSSFIAEGAKQRMTTQFLLLTKAWEMQVTSGGIYNEPAWTRLACVKDKVQL